jgi:hypothetical protein
VPVLSRGTAFTFGQSTRQIIDFLGLDERSGPELSTDALMGRIDKYMSAALELIPLMPADRLGIHVPGRPRSYRALSFHLFRVVAALLDAAAGIELTREAFGEEPAREATTAELTAYGESVHQRLRQWWATGDTTPSRPLPTYYGTVSLHELMERTAWHCGQHVRQYMMLLEKEGVSHHQPLKPPDFTQLPFPQNVWDG